MKLIFVLKQPTERAKIVDIINRMHKLHLHLMQQYDLTGDYTNVIEANDVFNNIIRLREMIDYWPTTDDK